MERQLIVTTFVVNFGLAYYVQPNNHIVDQAITGRANDGSEFRENFRNLFDSIATNNTQESEIYQKILKQEMKREQQVFDTMKENLQTKLNRNSLKRRTFYEKIISNENARAAKRETKEGNHDRGNGTCHWRSLSDAVKHKDIDAVKYWVEEERVPITQVDAKKQTVAHLAAGNDDVPVLEYLLRRDHEKFLINATDVKGLTVFHVAAYEGAVNVLKFLADEYREVVNVLERARKPPRNSAVHLAAENGRVNALKYLIEERGADVNEQNDLRQSPIFLAIQNRSVDTIRYIIEHTPVNLTLTDSMNSTILHAVAASCKNDTTIVEYLLGERQIPVDVNARNRFGETALLKAVTFNFLRFVEYLLSVRKVDLNTADFMNKTSLHQAAMLGYTGMVKCLVEHGADTEIRDCMGQRPLEVTQCEEVIEYLKKVARKRSRRSVNPSVWTGRRLGKSDPPVRTLVSTCS